MVFGEQAISSDQTKIGYNKFLRIFAKFYFSLQRQKNRQKKSCLLSEAGFKICFKNYFLTGAAVTGAEVAGFPLMISLISRSKAIGLKGMIPTCGAPCSP
ncbi:hypothetical protein SAMN05421827_13518 [Pedobacter terrae]|uniref:Uncharacterized protein n=1 Tax=Pedobacter terrae TaxID=405671 RepID=A0A1G8EAK4_9SPHI|nr:hypothetical protein SAMN05421827_13518 [Pedobacter terrae]